MKHMRSFFKTTMSLLLCLCIVFSGVNALIVSAESNNQYDYLEISGGTAGVDYVYADKVLTVKTSASLRITQPYRNIYLYYSHDVIKVESGVKANITLAGISLHNDTDGVCACSIDLSAAGDSTITLEAGTSNSIRSGNDYAGIRAPGNGKLTINGTGTLNASGGSSWPGIGGNGNEKGSIVIDGPTVTATGGENAAGIGGSWGYNGGNITIVSGNVTAFGGTYGAGIGSGANPAAGGTITIKGGTVNATGGADGAGIGGGSHGSGGTITIENGTVNAVGGQYGAGIGGGSDPTGLYGDNITIENGTVTATGGEKGAGIGSGMFGNYGTITVNGGNVNATGGVMGAGIGSGDNTQQGANNFGRIIINGGNIVANAPDSLGDPAAIGGGAYKPAGEVKIYGGSVFATGCKKGIGGGAGVQQGSIYIYDGYVNANGIGTGNEGGYQSSADVSITGGTVVCTDAQYGGINKSKQSSWKGIIVDGDTGAVYGYGDFTLNADLTNNGKFTVPSGSTLTIPAGITFTNTGTVENNGTIRNNGEIIRGGTFTGNSINGTGTISYNYRYLDCDANGQNWHNGTVSTNMCTVLSAYTPNIGKYNTTDWYILTSTVTVSSIITVRGDVHLILANGSKLYATQGINVSAGNSLTIYAQSTDEGTMGRVEATGGSQCAGIGGNYTSNTGAITINGGYIKAVGGDQAAGIGGGGKGDHLGYKGKSVESIVINGGIINAQGGSWAAGIGSGNEGSIDSLIINGGSVYAMGGAFGASIGGGSLSSKAVIVINGGTVDAPEPYSAFGIGSGGNGGHDTSLTITGGVVTTGIVGQHGDTTQLLGGVLIAGEIRTKYQESGWQGVYINGDTGTVYGDYTLKESFEIPAGKTLNINNGRSLTVPAGKTLKVTGGLNVKNGGTLTNNGTITGAGTIQIHGTIAGTGTYTGNGTVISDAPAANEGYTLNYVTETVTANSGYQVSADNTTWRSSVRVVPGGSVFVRKKSVAGSPASTPRENRLGERQAAPNNGEGYLIDYSTGHITVREVYEINTKADFSGTYIGNNASISAYIGQTLYIRRKAVTTSGKEKFSSEARPLLVSNSGFPFLYYDEDLQSWQTGSVNNGISVKADTTAWGVSGQDSCYVVSGDVTVSDRITVLGNVQLILADGCSLIAEKGIEVVAGNGLRIFGYSTDEDVMGSLTADGYEGNAGIGSHWASEISCGAITINGGQIIATGHTATGNPAGIGGGSYSGAGTVTINSGCVIANGSGKGIGGGAGVTSGQINIKGGTVTANGIGTDSYGGSVPTRIADGVIICSGNGINKANQSSWKGLILDGTTGGLYKTNEITLSAGITIPSGSTLTLNNGQTLTVPAGVTFTNKGTVNLNGTQIINGAFINDGTVNNNGTINGSGVLYCKDNSTLTGNGIIGKRINIYRPAPTEGGVYQISTAEQLMWFSALSNGTLPDKPEADINANAVLRENINLNPGYTFTFVPDTGLVTVTGNSTTFFLGTGIPGDLSGSDKAFDNAASGKGTVYTLSGSTYTENASADDCLRVWTPIGERQVVSYAGTFDGAGHFVSGVYTNRSEGFTGFIGYIQVSTVKNITLKNSYIRGGDRTGGIVGFSALITNIKNCLNEATVVGNEWVGGIVGDLHYSNAMGTHINMINTGVVSGAACVGGIAGIAGNVSHAYNRGFVYASGYTAGGIGGNISKGVELCFNSGIVSTPNESGEIQSNTLASSYFCEGLRGSEGRLSSGEITWLLNGTVRVDDSGNASFVPGATDGTQQFYQTIGADTYPKFTGKTVYYHESATPKYFNDLVDPEGSVTVTFNACEGLGSMATVLSPIGESFTMPSCTLTAPAGKQFKEWAVGSMNGAKVSAGGTYTFITDTTVYAVWEYITQAPSVGNGTKASPYEISTVRELYWFEEAVNGGATDICAKLTANINLNPDLTFTFDADTGLVIVTKAEEFPLIAYLGTGITGSTGGNDSFDTVPSVPGAWYSSRNSTDTCSSPFASMILEWTPVGTETKCYEGTFDGNGKTISGLYGNSDALPYSGFFGIIDGGSITDLTVANGYICGTDYTGGICAYNTSGSITGCANKITVVSDVNGAGTGGVCGYNASGSIENSCNTGIVVAKGNSVKVGGICGYNADASSSVKNSLNAGAVIANGSTAEVGSVCGTNSGNIASCYYKEGTAQRGIGNAEDSESTVSKTEAELASGVVARLLQKNIAPDTQTGTTPLTWGQTDLNTPGSLPVLTNEELHRVLIFGDPQTGKILSRSDMFNLHTVMNAAVGYDAQNGGLDVSDADVMYRADLNADGVVDVFDATLTELVESGHIKN